MKRWKAEDLVPGMTVQGVRGPVTLAKKLQDKTNSRGITMVRFECEGSAKVYSTEVGSVQTVFAIPASIAAQLRSGNAGKDGSHE